MTKLSLIMGSLLLFTISYLVSDFFRNYEYYKENKQKSRINFGKILTVLIIIIINAFLIISLWSFAKTLIDSGIGSLEIKRLVFSILFFVFVLFLDYMIFRSISEIKRIDEGKDSLLSNKNNKEKKK